MSSLGNGENCARNGFELCELIVGIDFTLSNTWNGKESFEGRCLHDISGEANLYMTALQLTAKQLSHLDADACIPCYGYGDATTGGKSVFSFLPEGEPITGLQGILDRYKQLVPYVDMSGPTTFAPLIRQAMRDVYNSGMKFHVLLILADGQISNEYTQETKTAIANAALFPLSIIVVGIGDGPWKAMREFDDSLSETRLGNLRFLEFGRIVAGKPEEMQGEEYEAVVIKHVAAHFGKVRHLVGKCDAEGVQYIVNSIPLQNLINPPAVNQSVSGQ